MRSRARHRNGGFMGDDTRRKAALNRAEREITTGEITDGSRRRNGALAQVPRGSRSERAYGPKGFGMPPLIGSLSSGRLFGVAPPRLTGRLARAPRCRNSCSAPEAPRSRSTGMRIAHAGVSETVRFYGRAGAESRSRRGE